MKAVRISRYGGPEALSYGDVPTPKPEAGQALVKIHAAGVNFVEVYQRTGMYQIALPAILGAEAAGVVEALGPGVTEVRVGDPVAFASANGSYAEYATVPVDKLVIVPAGVSLYHAAAVMLQGMTAHYLSHTTYALKAGDIALIHAGAGGVGLLLIQMARSLGARVISTVSTEEKAKLAREAGADHVVLYTKTDFEAEVKQLTAGAGVNVVYDSVGKTTFLKGLSCLKPLGTMVLFGASSGQPDPLAVSLLAQKGSLFLTRPTLQHYIADRAALLARAEEVLGAVAKGDMRVRIGHTYPLAEAAAAHQALEGRQTTGKVLLRP